MPRTHIFPLLALLPILLQAQDYRPVETRQLPVSDTFYGKYIITDKFRWLENVSSPETKAWLAAQDKMAGKYLSKAVAGTNAYNRIDKYAYAEYHLPKKMGNYYFTKAYYNNHDNYALFYQAMLNGRAEILVDPHEISTRDEISINGYSLSKNSKLLAYQFSRNGSDWNEVKVVSLPGAVDQKDHLKGLKFSGLEWLGDGFFYSTFHQDEKFGKTNGQRVFFHKIGTPQEEDKLIFGRKNSPNATFSYLTTSDERFFVLTETNEQTGITNIFYIDYTSPEPYLRPLITNLKKDIGILDSHDGKFIATTSMKSNNGSIVEINPDDPYKWRAIAGEFSAAVLLYAIPFDDRIVAVYRAKMHPVITVFDYSGAVLFNLDFPVATTVGGFSGRSTDDELLYYYTSYTVPPVVYKFNIRTFRKELADQTVVTFDFNNIEYKALEYLSNDSVPVSMVLVYEKGLQLNGKNPAILKAYGGFGIISQPSFDPGIVCFIKSGGVFAYAGIRGGGDNGVNWANAGKGIHKQQSFDDFIAAAEYLVKNNYTCSEKLAATGGSNGGLVVAAAAIQRPDLFRAVVPVVAPLDMLRFEKFTVGHMHADEYGTITDSLSFLRLYNYSPYHQIREDVNYPAMLLVTSENDDRVPPFHSYKFAAEMQRRTAQTNPVILKLQKNAGHSGSSTLVATIDEEADLYGFIMNILMASGK